MIEPRWTDESEARLRGLEALAQRGQSLTPMDEGALASFETFGPGSVKARVEALRRLVPQRTEEPAKPTNKPQDPLVAAALTALRSGRGNDA